MNLISQLLLRSRYPLAILAGLALALAFLEIGVAGLAWVAPALILATAHGKTGGDAFRIGYVAGLAHYLASLYWFLLIPVKGYPILGWASLSAYLALYPAVWVWLVSGVRCQVSGVSDTWTRRNLWALSGAAIWVALEMIVGRLLSGFPWNFIGTSQYRLLPLIQIASVTGVYGVSFLVVWFSLSIYSAVVAILRQPTTRHAWLGEIILPLAALVAVFVFGFGKLREPTSNGPTLRVTFVQPSIPQTMIWDEKENDNRFRQLLELTEQALTSIESDASQTNEPLNRSSRREEALTSSDATRMSLLTSAATEFMKGTRSGTKTDLILWPEAAVPKMIRYDEETFRTITGLAQSNRVWMIIGCDDAEPRLNSSNPDDGDYFNSSFLVSPEGKLANVYHKRNLVIFGEYIPLIRWLPFVKWFTPITGGFTSGNMLVPFELERRSPDRPEPVAARPNPHRADQEIGAPIRVKTATLICFEDVFPHLVREYVDDDTDFLVNLTNDGWFGEGAEQWQHAASAVFRSVENGLPLVRCCNNGLTCWIDSRGRLRDIFRDQNGSVYGAGVMTTQIPVLAPGEERPTTFYNEHGDWFGWGCVALAAFTTLRRLVKFRRGKTAAV